MHKMDLARRICKSLFDMDYDALPLTCWQKLMAYHIADKIVNNPDCTVFDLFGWMEEFETKILQWNRAVKGAKALHGLNEDRSIVNASRNW